jgi:hypothetical protein
MGIDYGYVSEKYNREETIRSTVTENVFLSKCGV